MRRITCDRAESCEAGRILVNSNHSGDEIQRLIELLAKLPGLGPRSGRRAALALIRKRETLLEPLAKAMADVAATVTECSVCGAVDTRDPCGICCDPARSRMRPQRAMHS